MSYSRVDLNDVDNIPVVNFKSPPPAAAVAAPPYSQTLISFDNVVNVTAPKVNDEMSDNPFSIHTNSDYDATVPSIASDYSQSVPTLSPDSLQFHGSDGTMNLDAYVPTGKMASTNYNSGSSGISGKMAPPPSAPAPSSSIPNLSGDIEHGIPSSANDTNSPGVGTGGMFSLSYYQYWFDVDTVTVLNRCRLAVVPHRPMLLEHVGDKPDLWGPFWITTTLIFLQAVMGNFSSWLAHDSTIGSAWQYDINKVTVAAAVLYTYTFIIPIIIKGIAIWWKVPLPVLAVVCLYGYVLIVFLPVTVLCIIPISILCWAIICVGTVWSLVSLLSNLNPVFSDPGIGPTKRGIILVGVSVGHFAIGLAFVLVFMQYDQPLVAPNIPRVPTIGDLPTPLL